MNNQRRFLWTCLFVGQLAAVATASALATAGRLPTTVFRAPFDRIGHLVAYGGLGFFGVARFGRDRFFRVVAVLIVAATLEELSQRAFPTRTFDLGDLAMNIVGIVAFGLAARLLERPRAPAEQHQ